MDICQVAGVAGAGSVARISTYDKALVQCLKEAIAFEGFSLVDIWGICPGRYTRGNKLTPKSIASDLDALPSLDGFEALNARMEYGRAYRQEAGQLEAVANPVPIRATCKAPAAGRQEIVLLGSAGQRIITAGELLCLAGATAGCHATQKNDYPITVMRGHSVSEIILSQAEIEYTGIENPSMVIALAPEGVKRREQTIAGLPSDAIVIKAVGVDLPSTRAAIVEVDFKHLKIRPADWAMAALTIMACRKQVLTMEMLKTALQLRFKQKVLGMALAVVEKASNFG